MYRKRGASGDLVVRCPVSSIRGNVVRPRILIFFMSSGAPTILKRRQVKGFLSDPRVHLRLSAFHVSASLHHATTEDNVRAVMDGALSMTDSSPAANSPEKPYLELEAVDAAVGQACRGLIRVLFEAQVRQHSSLALECDA